VIESSEAIAGRQTVALLAITCRHAT